MAGQRLPGQLVVIKRSKNQKFTQKLFKINEQEGENPKIINSMFSQQRIHKIIESQTKNKIEDLENEVMYRTTFVECSSMFSMIRCRLTLW